MGVEWRKGAWHLRLKHADGKWRYSRTECTTKAEANALYAEEAARMERVRRGLVPLDMNPKKWTLWDLLVWWLERYASKLAEHGRATSALTVHIKESVAASLPLEHVTAGVVQRLLKDTGGSVYVQRNLRGYISRAFNAAIGEDLFFGANPVVKVKRIKLPKHTETFLELEEIDALFEHLDALVESDDDRVAEPAKQRKLVYAIALYTGARRGEIWALRWKNVDLKRGRITIAASNERDVTKSGKDRVIDIAPDLRPILEAAKGKPDELVCPGRGGELRSADAKAAKQLRKDLKGAGVPRDITFHELRDTFASWWLMNGNSLESLQEVLGHATIEITRSRYGHLSQKFVSEQWKRFSLEPPNAAEVLPMAGSIRGAK